MLMLIKKKKKKKRGPGKNRVKWTRHKAYLNETCQRSNFPLAITEDMIQSISKERQETRKCLSHLTNKNLKNAVTPPWYSKQCFKKIRNSKQKGELRHLPRIVEPKESSVNLRCRFLTAKMPSTPLTPRRTD